MSAPDPTIRSKLGPEQLAIWDCEMKRSVEPGKVDVMIGANSATTQTIVLEVQPWSIRSFRQRDPFASRSSKRIESQ